MMSWGFRKSKTGAPGVRVSSAKRVPGIGVGRLGLRVGFLRKKL